MIQDVCHSVSCFTPYVSGNSFHHRYSWDKWWSVMKCIWDSAGVIVMKEAAKPVVAGRKLPSRLFRPFSCWCRYSFLSSDGCCLQFTMHGTYKLKNICVPLMWSCINVTVCALTPWGRVIEKLIITHLIKFFAFRGIRRFITVSTRARHFPYPTPDESIHILTLFL
jgi:hypothetical protein